MLPSKTCLKCGSALPPRAPGKFCPKCVFPRMLAAIGLPPNPPTSADSRRWADYELLEEIARGGMGVIYRARQLSLNRLVALKTILSGQFASEAEVKRFRAEAEAAARLEHPNLVPVFEVGEHEGQHYFTMALVEGENLAKQICSYARDHRAAARLVATVARAVHYAHQRGVLHRDLKPSNILINAVGAPLITDFGLARRVGEHNGLTLTGAVLGTPNYMSPEQAEGKPHNLTTATDIYSLGAILYHLLTGQPPFDAETALRTIRQVVDQEPVRPRSVNPRVDRDLESICLKCLEKDPRNRYGSAEALAEDLERWWRREPILARPATSWERTLKWSCRNPAPAALVALSCTAVTAFVLVILLNQANLRRERDYAHAQEALAKREAKRAQAAIIEVELERANDLYPAGADPSVLSYLAYILRNDPHKRIAAERLVHELSHETIPLPATPPLTHQDRLTCARFSPDGSKVVTASSDHTARIWKADSGQPLAPPLQHRDRVHYAEFSPDGRLVVTASEDHTAGLWDAQTGELVTPPLQHEGPVYWAAFGGGGKKVATASGDKSARIWDGQTGHPLTEPLLHDSAVHSASFSSNGLLLLTVCGRAGRDQESQGSGGAARLWDAATGRLLGSPIPHPQAVTFAQFSPDGESFVTVSVDHSARLWEAQTGKPLGPPLEHSQPVNHAAFSPDGSRLVTALRNQAATLWDGRTGKRLAGLFAHRGEVLHACFSPDSQRMVTTSSDHSARLWEIDTGELVTGLMRHEGPIRWAEFSPDGQRVVTASDDGTAVIWDVRMGFILPKTLRHEKRIWHASFSPDGQRAATASADGTARVWAVAHARPLTQPLLHQGEVYRVCFSPDARQLLTCSEDGTARLWESDTGHASAQALQHAKAVPYAEFSRDARKVVTASWDHSARVWDAQTGAPLTPPLAHQGQVLEARFSPD